MNDGGTVEWRGDVFSVHAGIDGMLRDGVLVGLSGSKSSGVFDFTDQMGARDIGGEFEANLMSMHPYVAWIRDDIAIWATTGVGWGSMTMTDSIVAERSSNISSLVLATGASKTVHSSPIGSFAIRAEGWTSEVEIAGNVPDYLQNAVAPDHIAESSFQMRRARAMLDWMVYEKTVGEHSTAMRVQGGARFDRLKQEPGVGGAEFGAEVRFTSPYFRALGDGRVFVPKGSAYRERGIRGMIEIRSRRVALQVNPSYGNVTSGINQLWERGADYRLGDSPGGLHKGSAGICGRGRRGSRGEREMLCTDRGRRV